MTTRKLAEQIYDAGPRFEAMNETNREAWVQKIEKAILAEREVCASIAYYWDTINSAAREIAHAIRSRH